MKTSITLGTLPDRLHGTQLADLPLGTLDTGSVKYMVPYPAWKSALSDLGIEKGKAYPHLDGLYIKDTKLSLETEDTAIATLSLEGLLDGNGEKRLRSISAFGSIISIGPLAKVHIVDEESGVDPETEETVTTKRRVPQLDELGEQINRVIATPSGTAERWNIFDPGITVIDTYYTHTEPDTTKNGTAQTPPSAPAVSPFLWASYDEPQRANFPSGWILADRQIQPLYAPDGTSPGLWKVVDTSDYYYPSTPD